MAKTRIPINPNNSAGDSYYEYRRLYNSPGNTTSDLSSASMPKITLTPEQATKANAIFIQYNSLIESLARKAELKYGRFLSLNADDFQSAITSKIMATFKAEGDPFKSEVVSLHTKNLVKQIARNAVVDVFRTERRKISIPFSVVTKESGELLFTPLDNSKDLAQAEERKSRTTKKISALASNPAYGFTPRQLEYLKLYQASFGIPELDVKGARTLWLAEQLGIAPISIAKLQKKVMQKIRAVEEASGNTSMISVYSHKKPSAEKVALMKFLAENSQKFKLNDACVKYLNARIKADETGQFGNIENFIKNEAGLSDNQLNRVLRKIRKAVLSLDAGGGAGSVRESMVRKVA